MGERNEAFQDEQLWDILTGREAHVNIHGLTRSWWILENEGKFAKYWRTLILQICYYTGNFLLDPIEQIININHNK